MDLHQFPLDADYFCIKIGPKKLPEKECVLRVDPTKHRLKRTDSPEGLPGDRVKSNTLAEWVWCILFFLVLLSWVVFWQEPQDFGERFAAVITLLLAAVAFLYVVNDTLPRISYLTLMDKSG
eukprot:gene20670-51235_t